MPPTLLRTFPGTTAPSTATELGDPAMPIAQPEHRMAAAAATEVSSALRIARP
jgi:hypothetical protein